MYYTLVRSLDELLGDDGVLRLPKYLPDAFVMDENRLNAIELAVKWARAGKNVLIEGSPGTGKTALMFMVLKRLSQAYRIGYIKEGVASIGKEHMEKGVIIFYDDIPRMNRDALRSIIKHNVGGIIATARTEEAVALKRLLGMDLYNIFNVVELMPLSDDKIEIMLKNYLACEAIRVEDDEAIKEVVKKASGLPVYIWQVVRELKIMKKNLTRDYARAIPMGMLDYVDDILWRVLGGVSERYEALITLLIMTDFLKYAIHQDLYNYIYLVAKEKRLKKKLTLDDILLDPVIEDITRYLAKDKATFSFRLPHDSWADVLRGRSSGPMAPEISKINARYNYDTRKNIVIEAAKRAWRESTSKTNDIMRIDAFKNNIKINYGEGILTDIIEAKPEDIKEAISRFERPLPEMHATKMSVRPETGPALESKTFQGRTPVPRVLLKPPIVPTKAPMYQSKVAIKVAKICGGLALQLYLACLFLEFLYSAWSVAKDIPKILVVLIAIYLIGGVAVILTGTGILSVQSTLNKQMLGTFCAFAYIIWGAVVVVATINIAIIGRGAIHALGTSPPIIIYLIFPVICGVLTMATFKEERPREGLYAGFLIPLGGFLSLLGILGLVLLSIALLRIDAGKEVGGVKKEVNNSENH